MQPQIILLREGTENSQGRSQVISNITACQAVVDAVKTTLGPRGNGQTCSGQVMVCKSTISNDGATIMKLLDIVHPAAKTLVDIAKSQDAEVGDGTTSVVLLAGEFLKQCKPFVEEGVHPQVIIKSFREATALALEYIKEISVKIDNAKDQRHLLERCAATALSSKLLAFRKEFFAKMAVDAVMMLGELLPLSMIGIKKVQGGALEESCLVPGVAFKKTFSYAGFEMQPKTYIKPKIALLNIELELKAERDNAEIRVDSVEEYQNIVDAEWNILYDKLDKIHKSGVKVVLSKLPIGDVATQYFADRDLFCAGRVTDEDLKRTMKACGGAIQTTVSDLNPSVLGTCELFEENQIGDDRYNLFTGCPSAKTCTIILRGGAEQFIEETERSLHDAIMIVRRAIKNDAVVAGGGAIEMEVSKYLRDHSRTIAGKSQLIIGAMAKALEIIPRKLCDNAGFDATNILNKLRQKHATGEKWYGVDIMNEDIADNFEACVWEPVIVKSNAIIAASEATCLILSVDETIKNPAASGGGAPPQAPRGMGRGRPPMM
ncbi:T-complex protein 1 subunit eta [Nymphon striatum]|nr:T-complex protein 1 subunit eta [Nymphon striatum]